MRLVPRIAARAELLERQHQLDRVEHARDPGELGRRQATCEADELVARNVDVDEHAREPLVGERHRLLGHLEIEPMGDEEAVDHVELRDVLAVEAHDGAVSDHELGLGVARAVGGDETELGPRLDERLLPELGRLARAKACAAPLVSHAR